MKSKEMLATFFSSSKNKIKENFPTGRPFPWTNIEDVKLGFDQMSGLIMFFPTAHISLFTMQGKSSAVTRIIIFIFSLFHCLYL